MSLTEKTISFNNLEKEIYQSCCKAGRELLKNILEEYDTELQNSRDKKEYRCKGKRKTTVKAIFGEVEFERNIYETTEDGIRKYVYLLDEKLGLHKCGFFSDMMSKLIAKACCESTYREAARSVSECSGQSLSHTAAWNLVQQIGNRLDEHEKDMASLSVTGESSGTLKTPVLFQEKDGIWLHLQGKDRIYGSSKELKVSIAYDGAKLVGKKRYELTNKVACASFETAENFDLRTEGIISERYDTSMIQTRLVNGDGAGWVKEEERAPYVYFQLDVFHKNKKVRECIKDLNLRRKIWQWLYNCKDSQKILDGIEGLINAMEGDPLKAEEQEDLKDLYRYFKDNKQGLRAFHMRKDIEKPQLGEGKVYRHLGCMESNIFTIIGNRMKGRRACWSIAGAENLARILCLKHTKRFDSLESIFSQALLPERYLENVDMMPDYVPKSIGKGYDGYHQTTCPSCSDYQWLRDLGKIRSF